jgi:hypothetical protein
MRDNEKMQQPSRSLAPAWSILNVQHLSAGINDPERPGKYNSTEVKYKATLNICLMAFKHLLL